MKGAMHVKPKPAPAILPLGRRHNHGQTGL